MPDSDHDPRAQADAENYLIDVLESSNPRRDASTYHITEAVREYHDTAGDWNIRQADRDTVEELLARHAR